MEKTAKNVELIRRIDIFTELSETEAGSLLSIINEEDYKENDVVFTEESIGNRLYIVKSGTVDVIKKMRMSWGTEENKLARLNEGDFFGELSLFDNKPRSSTVKAFTHCTVLYLEREGFGGFIKNNPEIGLKVYGRIIMRLSQRLRNADETIRDLSVSVLHY